ncbi:MAG: UvrD-helicase domain-containing protein [Spirochaetes bacterium]|nr:UvrD-helicase domain-containing protein [Spirochaetota bacterium]
MRQDFRSLLNERQIEAVETVDRPLLIIAGAGSGKTRVITYRIAHLLARGVPQSEILAVTFTNKAAREMAQRIRSLVPKKPARLTISTFHAFGAQLLREHGKLLGYRDRFSIHDSQDQASLLKETARELGKTEGLDLAAAAQLISAVKTGRAAWNKDNRHLKPLFKEYEKNLRLYNAVDFDDLIMRPIELLSKFPEARQACHERYRHILVDEFQDTSAAQYDLLRLLAGPQAVVCVVGDDDQSIYSWRGASYENIVSFEKDFPGFHQVTLEQNYRSTKIILRAANALIACNANRKPKQLWSGLPEGEPIELFAAETEREEAEHIVSRIRALRIRESLKFRDFAVLLRANHLTRAIEEAFVEERIPYQVSGGMSFFERQEVRDMLSYLKLIANADDDRSLLRVANTPRRGIGKKALEKATEHASRLHCSLFSAFSALASGTGGSAAEGGAGLEEKLRSAVGEFTQLVGEFREKFLSGRKMAQTLRELVEEIDYWGHLVSDNRDARNKDVVKWKFANVEALIGSLADYEEDPDKASPSLYDYLTRVALASRDEPDEKGTEAAAEGRVNLMTIHAAKGLEFPAVFVAAVEQGLIPHARSMEEENPNLEEERRLFYVALTRAQRKLHVSWCASRRRMGKPTEAFPSPFIDELPPDCLSAQADEKDLSPEDAARLFAEARRKIFAGE